MDGIHDLGGMQGFGPVPIEDDVTFHEPWERAAQGLAIPVQVAADFNLDAFRHAIERVPPSQYLEGYFQRWTRAFETVLVEGGVLAEGELDARIDGRTVETAPQRQTAVTAGGGGAKRAANATAQFAPGDSVRTKDVRSSGHTRLPGYARGRTGTIALVNDAWVLPDTNAHGGGEQPTWVYAVRFEATELWGADAVSSDAVYLDCFETYLEPLL